MNTPRSAVLTAVLALLALSTTTAQDRRHEPDPKLKAAFEDLRTSMRTWRNDNVIPRLREWKAQYDASLSPTDLSALNGLRTRATALRRERKELMARARQAWRAGNTEEAATLRQQGQQLRERYTALLKELKPIAERSRTKLEEIGATAQPQVATWREQGRAIAQSWFDKNRELLANNPFPQHAGRMARSQWPLSDQNKRRAAVRFMLWDGGDFDEMDQSPQQNDASDPALD